MKFFKKGKPPKRQRLKGFLEYKSYYPDYHMIQTVNGFVKMYQIEDFNSSIREEYEKQLFEMIITPKNSITQISHVNGTDYLIITKCADTPEEAYKFFQSLTLPYREVKIEEWFTVICEISQFSVFEKTEQIGAVDKKGKPKSSILPFLQPYKSAPRYDEKGKVLKMNETRVLYYNDQFIRTVILTNMPVYIYPSLMTEILKISDNLVSTLFFRAIDKEKCKYAFENFQFHMSAVRAKTMKEELNRDDDLLNTCVLIMVHDKEKSRVNELVDMITETAKSFMTNTNVMDHQQYQTYRSMIPLGMNYIHYNKVLHREDLLGLLPLSWSRHVNNTIYYGVESKTQMKIYYNRLLTKANGFYLGSNPELVQKRILKEIAEFKKAKTDIQIAIFTLDSNLCKCITEKYPTIYACPKLFTGNQEIDLEVLRLVSIILCGHKGYLSQEKLNLIKETFLESEDIEGFIRNMKQKDTTLGRQLEIINLGAAKENSGVSEKGGNINVVQCGRNDSRYAEKVGILLQCLAATTADVVYVLSAEVLADSKFPRKIEKQKPDTIFSWCSIKRESSDYFELYLGEPMAKMIKKAEFLDITTHSIIDRIHLCGILEFDKQQKAILSSPDGASGILITGDTMYVYENLDVKNDNDIDLTD